MSMKVHRNPICATKLRSKRYLNINSIESFKRGNNVDSDSYWIRIRFVSDSFFSPLLHCEAITKRIRNECETKTAANLVKQRFLTGEVAFIASVRRLLCKGLTRRSRQGPVIHLTARSLTILKSDIRLRGVGYPSSSTWISDSADSAS